VNMNCAGGGDRNSEAVRSAGVIALWRVTAACAVRCEVNTKLINNSDTD